MTVFIYFLFLSNDLYEPHRRGGQSVMEHLFSLYQMKLSSKPLCYLSGKKFIQPFWGTLVVWLGPGGIICRGGYPRSWSLVSWLPLRSPLPRPMLVLLLLDHHGYRNLCQCCALCQGSSLPMHDISLCPWGLPAFCGHYLVPRAVGAQVSCVYILRLPGCWMEGGSSKYLRVAWIHTSCLWMAFNRFFVNDTNVDQKLRKLYSLELFKYPVKLYCIYCILSECSMN